MASNMIFKKVLSLGAILLMGWVYVPSANAQILTRDKDVEKIVEDILEETENANEARTKFEDDKTDKYYKDAIERLDSLIDALSNIDSEARDPEIFSALTNQSPVREKILAVSAGAGTTYGLNSLPDGSANVEAYLKRYGYLTPDQLYPDNVAFNNQLSDEHKALYYSDAIIGEVDASRQARYDAYENLIVKASQSDDAHEALDINNALLIENGRNLALLIKLQTAQLSADTALLREQTRSRESTSNIFGLRGATN